MGLVVPWGMTLVIADAYSVFVKCLPRQPRILIIIILGDLVCGFHKFVYFMKNFAVSLPSPKCKTNVCSFYYRPYRISPSLQPARRLVPQISYLIPMNRTARQSYVLDISYPLQWLSFLGSFHSVPLCSIFGFFLLCKDPVAVVIYGK